MEAKMSQSVLLHALSLNDRILEPNKLPLCGHVWAFDKALMGKEMFVGNCISVLSLLGSQDATINWQNDLMVFDTHLNDQTATVLISLQDDSLASDYYYFFGVWMAPDDALKGEADDWLAEPIDWEQEDLFAPAIAFNVTVADEPLQLPQVRKMVGREVFAEGVCHSTFKLYGSIDVHPCLSGRFVMCPSVHAGNHGRFEIRHSLYSLRNLMALAGRVMKTYDQIQNSSALEGLSLDMEQLIRMLNNDAVERTGWDSMARECGRLALLTTTEEMDYQKKYVDVCNLLKLFEAIEAELDVSEISGIPSLAARMKMPFDYASRLIDEKLAVMGGLEKQGGILQAQINNRILASQQSMLEQLLNSRS
ncbi:hypothetical protein AL013_01825 [Mariprofundus ferrooxydans]|uniref:Uncharacterized protein n=2 Tax=Mariprofundus ferrooxydans TaxID=314344 RepID=Q0F2M6_9PROT|nr:hypothetical protein SPV1_01212 [Mariprofundus ferrooxydans PV-1]KON48731.1 hypothetical protein AL013_01825 [Mariprofundus ferrooxydans]